MNLNKKKYWSPKYHVCIHNIDDFIENPNNGFRIGTCYYVSMILYFIGSKWWSFIKMHGKRKEKGIIDVLLVYRLKKRRRCVQFSKTPKNTEKHWKTTKQRTLKIKFKAIWSNTQTTPATKLRLNWTDVTKWSHTINKRWIKRIFDAINIIKPKTNSKWIRE